MKRFYFTVGIGQYFIAFIISSSTCTPFEVSKH